MSAFITVEKRHLEHLLSQAEAADRQNVSAENKLLDPDSVTISNSEYKHLLQECERFNRLKESLLNGGLSTESLDVLIYGPTLRETQPNQGVIRENPMGRREVSSPSVDYHHERSNNHGLSTNYDDDDDDDDDEDGLMDPQDSDGKDDCEESSRTTGSFAGTADRRTVLIRNLPDRVTHKDLVENMRGGALLHIYLRAREHLASVSFVEEADAQGFLQHAKNYGFYVAGRRVEVLWNDRQFYMPPFVRAKINNGASRNIILHNANPNITEGLIRRDLDHIHNLIVVAVKFKNGNAYISTNSVHNALFARSCMMSRLTYKGMRIGFYPDECNQPLAKIPTGPKKDVQGGVKKPASIPNRFQLLSLDGGEEEDSDGSEGLNGTHLGNGIHWADNRVSA
ncbi:hypothetical protein P170DRAFT_510737 [Aspergillus steynii IBT 23096]|uniref:RRM domain-containing protein n=1 Tax=Aspergillus steynii IBT 23096 TaxID=1392250 RepID=A0A2I2G587_9EURO|nr:uncharacterized protein P170DRAFT_510737 [Aspergillus steynii IBT 23096]PLB48042.1 hypothetical protein P170DRAFT_510737 [Aspergillus steynii IBT 23096]